MKITLLVSIFFMSFFSYQSFDSFISNEKSSYCIMSMYDNTILDCNNSQPQSVASISKIMTAIVVIENTDLNKIIKISDNLNSSYGSSIYLKKGDVYTIKDLLYGLMLRSGNDAAILLSETCSGTTKKFVEKMNTFAKKIGMKNTLFRNPSGLDEEDGGNISSACDMALLMSYAMKNDIFKEIVNTKIYRLNNGTTWINKNHFLNDYEYATGGKTGYTKKAGRTLVTTSKKNNMGIVVVTFNVANDFKEHINMHQTMHAQYQLEKIIDSGIYKYRNKCVYIEQPYYQIVEKGKEKEIHVYSSWNKYELMIKTYYKNLHHKEKYEVKYE